MIIIASIQFIINLISSKLPSIIDNFHFFQTKIIILYTDAHTIFYAYSNLKKINDDTLAL